MNSDKRAKSAAMITPLLTEARLGEAVAAAFLIVFSVQTLAVFA